MTKNESIKTEYRDNLSAYIDNELDPEQSIKIRKLTVVSPSARKELENMYKCRKLMFSAYNRTKNEMKKDYSKKIVSKISGEYYYTTTYFKKIAVLFALIIAAIISGFVYLYL